MYTWRIPFQSCMCKNAIQNSSWSSELLSALAWGRGKGGGAVDCTSLFSDQACKYEGSSPAWPHKNNCRSRLLLEAIPKWWILLIKFSDEFSWRGDDTSKILIRPYWPTVVLRPQGHQTKTKKGATSTYRCWGIAGAWMIEQSERISKEIHRKLQCGGDHKQLHEWAKWAN